MIRNTHERTLEASSARVGALLETLGQPNDHLWPSPHWAPMLLDRPLGIGAEGGHGSIRYRVSEYEPGRRVRFTFTQGTGIDGMHELSVEPLTDDRCRLRHVLIGRPRGLMRLLAPLAVESLHDAVLEDLLDNAERQATGRLSSAARWSPWVRLWRWIVEGSEKRTGAQLAARPYAVPHG